jgi:hypothetical protein
MAANKRTVTFSTCTQLREMLYPDSEGMLVLSSTVASCYYNCCIDSSTSSENFGYSLVATVALFVHMGHRANVNSITAEILFRFLNISHSYS